MNPAADSTDPEIPEHLMCGCGEPMKLNRDKRFAPVGCPKCRSEVCFDDGDEFNAAVELLHQYWLRRGRRDYAGME